MPKGIPPKKKRPKSRWMELFMFEPPLTEDEMYVRQITAQKRKLYLRSSKSAKHSTDK